MGIEVTMSQGDNHQLGGGFAATSELAVWSDQ